MIQTVAGRRKNWLSLRTEGRIENVNSQAVENIEERETAVPKAESHGNPRIYIYCALSICQALSWVLPRLIFTAIGQSINISILYLRKHREVKSQRGTLGRGTMKAGFV